MSRALAPSSASRGGSFHDVYLVARREFTERLRDRSFLIMNVFFVVILVGAPLLSAVLTGDDGPIRMGAVGAEAGAVAQAAASSAEVFDLELEVAQVGDRAAAEAALTGGDLDAVLLDARTVLVETELPGDLEPLLASAASGVALSRVLTEAGVGAQEQADLAAAPLAVDTLIEPDQFDFGPNFLIGLIGILLLYGLLFLYGQWVAQGIVEEKSSRVIEVLLSAVSPTRLLAGKVLGLGLLGFLQVLAIAGIGVGTVVLTGIVELPEGAPGTIALIVAWFVLGYATYATVFAIAGALAARAEDLQSTVMPVYVLLIGALFIAQFTAQDPASIWSRVAGLAPFTAPLLQPLRTSVGASQPWEVVAAVALTLLTIAVLIPLAARFYGGGVLQVSRKIGLRDAWRGGR